MASQFFPQLAAALVLSLHAGCGSEEAAPNDAGQDARGVADASPFDGSALDARASGCTPTRLELGVVSSFFVPMDIAVTRNGIVHAAYAGLNIEGAAPYYTNASGSWVEELVNDDSFFHDGTRISVVPVYGSEHVYLFVAGSWVTNRSGTWQPIDAPFGHEAGQGRGASLYGTGSTALQSNRGGSFESLLTLDEEHGCQAYALGLDDRVSVACLRRNPETRLDELHYIQEDVDGVFRREETGLAFDRPNRIFVGSGIARPQFALSVRGSQLLVRWNGSAWTTSTVDTTIRSLIGFAISEDDSAHLLDGYFTTGLRYISNASGQWTTTEVTSRFIEGMAAITIDVDGGLHIAYAGQDDGAKRVRYTRICL